MNAKDRLLEFLKHLGIGQNTFEAKVGISNGYISNNKGSIGSQIISKISAAYPELNVIWLSTGIGEMLLPKTTLYVAQQIENMMVAEPQIPFLRQERGQMVPHILEECADCGKPNGFDIAILERQCPKYSIPGLVGCDFTIPARGRSMINRTVPEKSIKDGDIIGCRKWTSRSYIRWGEVYVLSTTEGITVKQIQQSDREGFIKCVPFNIDEGFQTFELPLSEVYDWALVVGVVSVSMWS